MEGLAQGTNCTFIVLLLTSLTLLFLVLSNLTIQSLSRVIWFEQPISRNQDSGSWSTFVLSRLKYN